MVLSNKTNTQEQKRLTFQGGVTLVTAAGSGIGALLAKLPAENSARGVVADLNLERPLESAVNNAGIGWDKVISINLLGAAYGKRFQIEQFLTQSIAVYIAATYGAEGTGINAVGPACIDTPLLRELLDAAREGFIVH